MLDDELLDVELLEPEVLDVEVPELAVLAEEVDGVVASAFFSAGLVELEEESRESVR